MEWGECLPEEHRGYWHFALGKIFSGRDDLAKDTVQAKHYFNLSGELGYGCSYNELCDVYLDDEKDWLKAKELCEKGVALQHVVAMRQLGWHYSKGKFGGEINFGLARKWLKKGTRLGHAERWGQLGRMCALGQRAAANKERAICMLQRGADKGDENSECWLGACYDGGDGAPRSHEQAQRWREKAAEQGNEHAASCLAELFDS